LKRLEEASERVNRFLTAYPENEYLKKMKYKINKRINKK